MDNSAEKNEGSPNLVEMFQSSKEEEKGSMDRKIKKNKWPPKRIAIYGIVAIVVIFVGYQLMYGVSGSSLNVDAEKLTIATVTYGPFQEYIAEQGAVIPLTTIYLDAMEGGRVEEKFVEGGTPVIEGTPILRLSNTTLQLNVMQREAELFEQTNNLRSTRVTMEQRRLSMRTQLVDMNFQHRQAERDYNRQKTLLEEELIAREIFKMAQDNYHRVTESRNVLLETIRQDSLFQETQIAQLEASVTRLEANLGIIKQNEESLTLRAPISGLLTALDAEIGESKQRGQRLGQIDVEDRFKVRVEIDEHYIARINVGQTATFDFAGRSYKLAITKVYLEVINGQFEADMEFVGEVPQGLRRGQTLQIRLELGELTDALQIPMGGFFQKTGGQWIYVVDSSGEFATKRPIRVGRRNARYYELLEGLEPGERIITSMYDNFGDMDRLVLK